MVDLATSWPSNRNSAWMRGVAQVAPDHLPGRLQRLYLIENLDADPLNRIRSFGAVIYLEAPSPRCQRHQSASKT